MDDNVLDGNAIGGMLMEVFGTEMTTAVATCGSCGAASQVAEHLRNSLEGYLFPVEEVRDALDEFCRARLMVGEDGKYLSLAIPLNPNW